MLGVPTYQYADVLMVCGIVSFSFGVLTTPTPPSATCLA